MLRGKRAFLLILCDVCTVAFTSDMPGTRIQRVHRLDKDPYVDTSVPLMLFMIDTVVYTPNPNSSDTEFHAGEVH